MSPKNAEVAPSDDWRTQPTVSVPFAGTVLGGLSRNGSYDAASGGHSDYSSRASHGRAGHPPSSDAWRIARADGRVVRGRPPVPLAERFWPKVDKSAGPDGCWLWAAYVDRYGYGQTSDSERRNRGAHCVAYELLVGPIPEGLELDHLCHTDDPSCPGGACRHRRCVNPAHLEPVPPAENTRRGVPANRTHCPQGHAYDEANTYLRPDGRRQCRACSRKASRDCKTADTSVGAFGRGAIRGGSMTVAPDTDTDRPPLHVPPSPRRRYDRDAAIAATMTRYGFRPAPLACRSSAVLSYSSPARGPGGLCGGTRRRPNAMTPRAKFPGRSPRLSTKSVDESVSRRSRFCRGCNSARCWPCVRRSAWTSSTRGSVLVELAKTLVVAIAWLEAGES